MSNKLVLFTMTSCGGCKYVKKKLKENNITFTDIDIDDYPDVWSKVIEQTQNDYVPTAYIIKDNEDEGLIFSPGVDYDEADDLIKKIMDNL